VGGHTKPAIRRTARLGDGWLPIGGRPPAVLSPDEVEAGVALMRQEAAAAGRDPDRLRVCFSTTVAFADTATAVAAPGLGFNGTPDQIAAAIDSYRQAGCDSFVLNFGQDTTADLEARMRRFVEEVRPRLGRPSATPS
jgi:alkanesulfonate monooxygenase SsuD/methylene tetrahydromethanopterin reductase-like flavin-dependent oxidoreductase (luciferase family)